MKCRDFVQQLLDGTVLNEKHRKIIAQVTSEMEQKSSHRRKFSGGCKYVLKSVFCFTQAATNK